MRCVAVHSYESSVSMFSVCVQPCVCLCFLVRVCVLVLGFSLTQLFEGSRDQSAES